MCEIDLVRNWRLEGGSEKILVHATYIYIIITGKINPPLNSCCILKSLNKFKHRRQQARLYCFVSHIFSDSNLWLKHIQVKWIFPYPICVLTFYDIESLIMIKVYTHFPWLSMILFTFNRTICSKSWRNSDATVYGAHQYMEHITHLIIYIHIPYIQWSFIKNEGNEHFNTKDLTNIERKCVYIYSEERQIESWPPPSAILQGNHLDQNQYISFCVCSLCPRNGSSRILQQHNITFRINRSILDQQWIHHNPTCSRIICREFHPIIG